MAVPALGADRLAVTDILPSGVPLPFPSSALDSSSESWDTTIIGDPSSLRSRMHDYGVRFSLQDVEELWGDVAGGRSRGASYNGMTAMMLTMNTGPLPGWRNGLFNVSALQIRGRSFTGDRVGALNTISGYDAGRSTRLFELWYGQGFLGNRLDIRPGAIDPDTEFIVSDNASLFLNASFG